jgi:hypothetical protein
MSSSITVIASGSPSRVRTLYIPLMEPKVLLEMSTFHQVDIYLPPTYGVWDSSQVEEFDMH